MIFYLMIIMIATITLCFLIGLYCFRKQNYNNFFVNLLLNQDKIKLIESIKVNEKRYKNIKLILSIQTMLITVLSIAFICIFRSYNITGRIIIIILIFSVRFISNKYIEINIFK